MNKMTTQLKDSKSAIQYRVVSVKKTDTPKGMQEDNWFRYIIGQGQSKIEGLRTGTLKTVTEHAKSVAEDLNLRGKKGFSPSITGMKKNRG